MTTTTYTLYAVGSFHCDSELDEHMSVTMQGTMWDAIETIERVMVDRLVAHLDEPTEKDMGVALELFQSECRDGAWDIRTSECRDGAWDVQIS